MRQIEMTLSDSPARKRGVGANSAQLSFTGIELYRFEVSVNRNAFFLKIGVK